jgi:hypothetical protein
VTPDLRPMRATDMVRFSRFGIPKFYGVIASIEGEYIGAAAIVWRLDRPFLCLQATEKLKKMPIFMTKFARKMIAAGTHGGAELFAMEDPKEPGAAKWLHLLGFSPIGEEIEGSRVLRHGG